MKLNRLIYLALTIAMLLASCQSQPDYVIDKDRMVDLLIDIHKTEAVINLNYTSFPTDEKKRALREAVYMRHNINEAEFDTSLVWYGKHLDVYMEVYDEVIKRLKAEDAEIKALIAEENVQVLTLAGDTVDIWKQDRSYVFNPNKGENIWAFSIDHDENFKRCDHFILRFHTINIHTTGMPATAHLAVRHNNQLIHYTTTVVNEGWNSIKIQSDSIQTLSKVYGYIAMPPRKDAHIMYINDIELTRIHNTASMPNEEFRAITIENKRTEDKVKKAEKAITPDSKNKTIKNSLKFPKNINLATDKK